MTSCKRLAASILLLSCFLSLALSASLAGEGQAPTPTAAVSLRSPLPANPQLSNPCRVEHYVIPSECGTLADALRIRELKGEFKLKSEATRIAMRLDFFKKGKKLEELSRTTQVCEVTVPFTGRYALHLIDLDYLPLGQAKPQHVRIYAQVKAGDGHLCSVEVDVPKSVFDHPLSGQDSRFSDGQPGEAPLACVITGTNRVNWGRTPKDVVEANPDADILMATLVYE